MQRFWTAGLLALALASPSRADDKPEEKKLPPDLAVIPGDAAGFLTVRVADLLADPDVSPLLPRVEKLLGTRMLESLAKQIVPPENIERLTMTLLGGGGEALPLAIRTRKPLDRAALAKRYRAEEKRLRGHTFLLLPERAARPVEERPALYLPDDHTVVLNHVKEVFRVLDGKAAGPLDDARTLAERHDVVLAAQPAQLAFTPLLYPGGRRNKDREEELRAFLESAPLAALLFKPVLQAKTGTVALDLQGCRFRVEARLSCKDARALADAETVARAGLYLAREAVPRLLGDAGLDTRDRPVAELVEGLQASVRAARLEQGGLVLAATARHTVAPGSLAALCEAARYAGQLKEIGLAFHEYHDRHGNLPTAALYTAEGKPGLSWRVALLPCLKEEKLYKEFKLDEAWDGPHNRKLLAKMPAVFAPPKGVKAPAGHTFFRVFTGPNTVFPDPKRPRAGTPLVGLRLTQITDGTSNTLLMAEAAESVPWTKPEELPVQPKKALPRLGARPGAFFALFTDGSVKRLRSDLEDETLRLLIDPNDGIPIPGNLEAASKP